MKKFLPIFLLALLSLLVGCSTDGVGKPDPGKYTINGSVQKGPFVLGSTINIQSLNGKLNPTGQSYVTSTNDDAGHFDLGSTLSNKYAEIIATGYYFDEVVGDLSRGTLTLRSITDLSDGGNTNVNLLTTLVYNRTQNLVKNSGKSIADATAQAEQELFLALGIKETDIPDVRCAKMDISQAGDHNALLLTISVALQYNRSTAALTELISKLAVDLADDGQIARDKVQSLYISESVDNLATQVRSNLINRYNQLGTQNNVPHFDKYLGYFLDINGNGVADKVEFVILNEDSAEFSAKGGEYTLSFSFIELENCEFVLSEGADEWLTLNTDGDVCQLTVDYNATTEAREAEIIIKERNGDKSLKFYVSQMASFHIEFSCDAGANANDFIFISDAEHFTTELNEGNGILLLTSAPSYIERIAGPFISITIPECVEYFNTGAFSECDTLKEFKGKWASDDGRYLADGTELLYYITTGLADFIIPQNITTISSSAFYGSTMSCTVTIPASVTEIKDYAFAYCDNVSLFKFESLTPPSLADTVFEGVDNLQISIPIEAVEAYLTCDWPYDYRRAIIEFVDIDNIPDSYRIYYTTNNNQKLDVYPVDGRTVLSHNYTDGVGIVVFFEPLTTIGNYAFFGCSSLTCITIPEGVTSIGNGAFMDCSSLTSITIPEGVTSIREDTFNACSSLTSITIPEGVIEIGGGVFGGCSSLTSITIPESVIKIGGGVFNGCSSLTSITIPEGVVSIEESTFYYCTSLTSVNIPDSVTTIGEEAFFHCESLTSVTIGDGVTLIGYAAFDGCNSLTEFKGKFATEDGYALVSNGTLMVFAKACGIDEYTIPANITHIEGRVFANCSNISLFRFESTTPPTLGEGVFDGIENLQISIPIEAVEAYLTCDWPHEYRRAIIEFADINNIPDSCRIDYTTNNNKKLDVYPEGYTVLSHDYSNGQGIIVFFEPLTTIGNNAFNGCSSLTSVNIPDSVTTIGYSAFHGCSSLTSVNIPDSVTTIRDFAFAYCYRLTSVNIPDSVTTIGDDAFSGCSSITSITIPDGVTSIGELAFSDCSSLTSITIPDSVTEIGKGAFSGCISLQEFKGKFATEDGRSLIKDNSIIAYADASGTAYTIPDSVTTIGDSAFKDCNSLTSVTIPNSVTTIGNSAFYSCYGLTSITIPDSVTTIGEYAFIVCNSLTSVNIPDNVTSIGDYAFTGCARLTSVTIGDSVTTIGDWAFDNCYSLTSVYCKAVTPPAGGSSMFGDNASGRKIYVPMESVEAYKSADGWADYAYSIVGYDFDNGVVVE